MKICLSITFGSKLKHWNFNNLLSQLPATATCPFACLYLHSSSQPHFPSTESLAYINDHHTQIGSFSQVESYGASIYFLTILTSPDPSNCVTKSKMDLKSSGNPGSKVARFTMRESRCTSCLCT